MCSASLRSSCSCSAPLGRYAYGLAGWWRIVYVAGARLALYLNCFVAVIQFFQKFASPNQFAPTKASRPS